MNARLLVLSLCGCLFGATSAKPPTLAEAQAFIDQAEATLLALNIAESRADWVKSTFITHDTEILAAKADEQSISTTVRLVKEANRFDKLQMPEDLARKFRLLKLSLTLAAPSNQKEAEELTQIASAMEGTYGRGKYCPTPGKCLDLEELSRILRTSTDPKELLDTWRGWHTISPPLKQPYVKYAALGNKGARELGFADMGAM